MLHRLLTADVKHADYPNADLLRLAVLKDRRSIRSSGESPPASRSDGSSFARDQARRNSESSLRTASLRV